MTGAAPLPMSGPRRLLSGLGAMLLGTSGVLALLVAMNRPARLPEAPPPQPPVSFTVEAPKPPPKAARTRPPPRRAPPRPSAAPPSPSLAAALPGLSFGLPAADAGLGAVEESLLGDRGAAVMTAEAVDAPPRAVSAPPVPYPPRARARGISGAVVLSILVQADGSVGDVRILESTPPGVFDEAAVAAVRSWRFAPGTYQGRAVAVRARQTLRFDLS